ncbi:MAG: DUF1015 domain-containing protein [Myxococcaceae bacterium]
MSLFRPFKALRPPREKVKHVASPPYDVVSRAEAKAYAQGNPDSFLHVSRPDIDLPDEIDEHDDRVYQQGLTALKDFKARGLLTQDPDGIFYLYQQRMGGHTQVGVVGCASVDAYDRGIIKKHELTRADKEDDRTKHIEVLSANDEPVFLTYRQDEHIDELIQNVLKYEPEYDFITEDGVQHTLWLVRGEGNGKLQKAFDEVPFLYIADGHHRSAAASRVQKSLRKKRMRGEHDWFLAVAFPHNQMQILAYNRVIKDLNGLTEDQFIQRIVPAFEIDTAIEKAPSRPHEFGMYIGGKWHKLIARETAIGNSPTGILDVAILQRNVLTPLGIADPRTDKRISFIGGIKGTDALEKAVNSGEYKVAFAMFPTSMEQLMNVADAGQIMPPKSTWFEPKLRSGLFVHSF